METPSQKLAAKIIDRMIKANLLSKAEGEKIVSNVGAGKQRPEDWRVAFEKSERREVE